MKIEKIYPNFLQSKLIIQAFIRFFFGLLNYIVKRSQKFKLHWEQSEQILIFVYS